MEGTALHHCKFHQSGHCKFGSSCKHFHTKDTCSNTICDKKSCTLRHPRSCKYFNRLGNCKLGADCSYLHNVSPFQGLLNDVKQIHDELQLVQNVLKVKETEIQNLQEIVDELNCKVESMESKKEETCFKCDICEYSCSSKRILKIHNTMKHKKNTVKKVTHSPEIFRGHILDNSLQLSMTSEEREIEDNVSLQEIVYTEEVDGKCKYWTCPFSCTTKVDMTQHIMKKHTVVESIVFPSSTEQADCPDCGQSFFIDHKFAMHLCTEHFYSFDCHHCHNHIPGDDGYVVIHMNMCEAPCEGDPYCPCQP